MMLLRRLELIGGVAALIAGIAGLAYAAYSVPGETSNCVTQVSFTYCEGTVSSSQTVVASSGWSAVILAMLLFIPILLALLGFAIGDSISQARGSLPFLWLCALLLAGATTVALLSRFVYVEPPTLPDGLVFLPSVALGFVTAVLGTLARNRHAPAAS